MRTSVISHAVVVVVAAWSSVAQAGDQGSKTAVQQKLESQYTVTKTTDDKTDIVTAGSVIVLQKDKLEMVAVSTTGNPCPNLYKDGKLTQSGACRTGEKIKKLPLFGHTIPGADKAPTTRNFVTGEKFWVTKIDVKDTGKDAGVVMEFFSDAINDVRYKTSLTIAFKGNVPSPDDALKLVQEVVTVAPAEDDKKDDKKQEAKGDAGKSAPQGGKQQPAAAAGQQAAAAPAAEAAPAPIEAPPPPADAPAAAPPTVELGQTPDQVVAILGQPQKKAKVGTKEIYYYKDLKVTFVNGKVKDVQ